MSSTNISEIDINDLKSECKFKVEELFSHFENDIIVRVESLKAELDIIQENMIEMLRECKNGLSSSIDSEFKMKQQEFCLIEKSEDDNVLKEFNEELKSLKETFEMQIKSFSIEMSEWFPSSNHIATINGCLLIQKAKHTTPQLFDLTSVLQNCSSMCQLRDDSYVLTSADESLFVNVDRNFCSIIKKSNSIGGRLLNKPTAICTGYSNLVYICDSGNNRIIIVNDDLETIKKVFGKRGVEEGDFETPIDLCISDDALYVLEKNNKRIQKFSRMGVFLECFNLSLEKSLKSLQVTSNEFVILFDNCVQIIDRNLGSVQLISDLTTGNSLYLDENLVFYASDGNVRFYEKIDDNFKLKYERKLHQILSKNIQKAYVFNNFIIVLMDNKLAKFY